MSVKTLGTQAPKPSIKRDYQLSKSDRCDADCPAQAHVLVAGLEGELMFCAHHYNDIMSNESSRIAMEAFAIETFKQKEAG